MQHVVDCEPGVEAQAVTLQLTETNLHIFNIYRSQHSVLDINELFGLAASEPTIIAGDFNAHRRVIDSPSRPNEAGALFDWTLKEYPDVTLLNDVTQATHVGGGKLDLVFASAPL